MSKASVPTKCAKCGSEKIKHEELKMLSKYGASGIDSTYTRAQNVAILNSTTSELRPRPDHSSR